MKMTVLYNRFNILIEDEHGHYKLSHGLYTQRCDTGELNEAIPDFADILAEKIEKKRQVTA